MPTTDHDPRQAKQMSEAAEFGWGFAICGVIGDWALLVGGGTGELGGGTGTVLGVFLHLAMVGMVVKRSKQLRLAGWQTLIWALLAAPTLLWLAPLAILAGAKAPGDVQSTSEPAGSATTAPADDALAR